MDENKKTTSENKNLARIKNNKFKFKNPSGKKKADTFKLKIEIFPCYHSLNGDAEYGTPKDYTRMNYCGIGDKSISRELLPIERQRLEKFVEKFLKQLLDAGDDCAGIVTDIN